MTVALTCCQCGRAISEQDYSLADALHHFPNGPVCSQCDERED